MNLFAWAAEPQEPVNPAKPQREVLALAKTLSWVNPDLVSPLAARTNQQRPRYSFGLYEPLPPKATKPQTLAAIG